MPVMEVGIMRMTVCQGLMLMRVAMRFAAIPFEIVNMRVMRVVNVRMAVEQWLVGVQVGVVLGQV